MNRNRIESKFVYVTLITMMVLIFLLAWQAETRYGYGVAALFGGIVLMGIGNYQVNGSMRRKIGDAIQMAKAKSRFWWLPFAGISVALMGSILLFISDDTTSLEQLLSIFLVILTYFYTIQLLPDVSTKEGRAT